jgi:phosphoribosylformylglycinamidine synthase
MAPRRTLGASVSLERGDLRTDELLFGEDTGRVVATASPEVVVDLLQAAREAGIPAADIGRVKGRNLLVNVDGSPAVDVPVEDLRSAWEAGFLGVIG